jgi:hypothetical protein
MANSWHEEVCKIPANLFLAKKSLPNLKRFQLQFDNQTELDDKTSDLFS